MQIGAYAHEGRVLAVLTGRGGGGGIQQVPMRPTPPSVYQNLGGQGGGALAVRPDGGFPRGGAGLFNVSAWYKGSKTKTKGIITPSKRAKQRQHTQ